MLWSNCKIKKSTDYIFSLLVYGTCGGWSNLRSICFPLGGWNQNRSCESWVYGRYLQIPLLQGFVFLAHWSNCRTTSLNIPNFTGDDTKFQLNVHNFEVFHTQNTQKPILYLLFLIFLAKDSTWLSHKSLNYFVYPSFYVNVGYMNHAKKTRVFTGETHPLSPASPMRTLSSAAKTLQNMASEAGELELNVILRWFFRHFGDVGNRILNVFQTQ